MPNLRDRIVMDDEEVSAFVCTSRTVTCATNGPRGWPHLAPLWFVPAASIVGQWPDSHPPDPSTLLYAWTYRRSQKARNLMRDQRATLQIEDGASYEQLRGALFDTVVEFVEDPAAMATIGLALAARYRGQDVGEPFNMDDLPEAVRQHVLQQVPRRIGLRFIEQRRASWDHRKLPNQPTSR